MNNDELESMLTAIRKVHMENGTLCASVVIVTEKNDVVARICHFAECDSTGLITLVGGLETLKSELMETIKEEATPLLKKPKLTVAPTEPPIGGG